MAELTCENLRGELRQVVQETLCQELSEVANRVHRAVREEIQSFFERWSAECEVRAPKRCDGHVSEPLKAPPSGSSSLQPISSLSLFSTLPSMAGAGEPNSPLPSSSMTPANGSVNSASLPSARMEEDKLKRDNSGAPRMTPCSQRKVPLIRPEIQRDLVANRGPAAPAAAAEPSSVTVGVTQPPSDAPSKSETKEPESSEFSSILVPPASGTAEPRCSMGQHKAKFSFCTHLSPPGTEEPDQEEDQATGKKDRKISFSDVDETSKKRGARHRKPACAAIDDKESPKTGKEAVYGAGATNAGDIVKVVPLPESLCEAGGTFSNTGSVQSDADSQTFLNVGEDEESGAESGASGSTLDLEDHPQWVVDIQKTIRTCTTQIFERERCRPPDWWIRLVESTWFDYSATMFVILNAITIGIQADWSVRNLGSEQHLVFTVTEKLFCLVFTVELAMRVSIHGLLFFSVPGWKWNVFDTVVVSLQLFEEFMNILALANEDGEKWSTGNSNFNFVRVLRILRLLRVFRIIRIVRFVSELRTMVCSIVNSLRSLLWTVILIFMMLYVVGVYLTQLVSDHFAEIPETLDRSSPLWVRYGGLSLSILSLFQAMTGGVDWEDLVNPLMEEITPLLGLLFTVYIAFAILAMMNVVTAVFIETALQNANKDKDTDATQYIRKFIASDDESGQDAFIDETITWEDFKQRLRNPTKKKYFRALDLDIAEAKGLFQLLDTEGDGRIQVEEFVSWFLQLRGPAKAIDLATVMYNHKRLGTDWVKHAQFVEETLMDILTNMSSKIGNTARVSANEILAERRRASFQPVHLPQTTGCLSNIRNSTRNFARNSRGSRRSVRPSAVQANGPGYSSASSEDKAGSPKQLNVYSVMAE